MPVLLDEEPSEPTPFLKKQKAKIQDLACWQIAWDRYALAAAMVEVFPFYLGMRYKQVC